MIQRLLRYTIDSLFKKCNGYISRPKKYCDEMIKMNVKLQLTNDHTISMIKEYENRKLK